MKEKIYESLAKAQEEHNRAKDTITRDERKIRVRTSMLSQCERKIVYYALGYPEANVSPLGSLVTLGIGNQLHDFVQRTFKQ